MQKNPVMCFHQQSIRIFPCRCAGEDEEEEEDIQEKEELGRRGKKKYTERERCWKCEGYLKSEKTISSVNKGERGWWREQSPKRKGKN